MTLIRIRSQPSHPGSLPPKRLGCNCSADARRTSVLAPFNLGPHFTLTPVFLSPRRKKEILCTEIGAILVCLSFLLEINSPRLCVTSQLRMPSICKGKVARAGDGIQERRFPSGGLPLCSPAYPQGVLSGAETDAQRPQAVKPYNCRPNCRSKKESAFLRVLPGDRYKLYAGLIIIIFSHNETSIFFLVFPSGLRLDYFSNLKIYRF